MPDYKDPGHKIEPPEIRSLTDELSFWSAPFGLSLLEAIRYREKIKALDIGSGLGFPLIELAMRLGGDSEVYGIEPDVSGVERIGEKIKAYGLTNAKIIEGYAEELPFPDKQFDLITSNNGINNVLDLGKSLAEIKRVARPGAQFAFTFNTDRTFVEFYETYRETLYELGTPEFNRPLLEHIFEKRKPVTFMEKILTGSGFRINSMKEESFDYHFSSGTAMLNHFFIKTAFLKSWQEILPPERRNQVFEIIEKKLNERSRKLGELRMRVPFVIIDCESS